MTPFSWLSEHFWQRLIIEDGHKMYNLTNIFKSLSLGNLQVLFFFLCGIEYFKTVIFEIII